MTAEERSLERLVPDLLVEGEQTGQETLALHLERYRFAARQARPGRLLDIACGVGYGTHLLRSEAPGVVEALGVDLSAEAVDYARARYGVPGVSFRQADALGFHDPEGFDTIVSLETVEHVEAPLRLLSNLAGMLRPAGVLIASVPVTPSVDLNPHHRHDFTARSFRRMVRGLPLEEAASLRQTQPVALGPLLQRREARMSDLRQGLVAYYAAHPGAALRRVAATLRFGFTNRYLTIAWRRSS